RVRRAGIALAIRRLDQANEDFAAWFDGGTIGERWAYLTHARLFVIRNDLEGYRKYLGRLIESDGRRLDAGSIVELGRIVGLAPCPVEDAKRVLRLIRSYPRDPAAHPVELVGLAMALHRAGEWQEARATALEYMEQDAQDAWAVLPLMTE